MVTAPPRMVAYTLAALVGQLAHRRLSTDDGVTAAQVADFVVSLVSTGCARDGAGARAPLKLVSSCVLA